MTPAVLGGLTYVGPAFESALQDVKHDYPLLNVSQTFIIADILEDDGDCLALESDNQVAEYYYNQRIHRATEGQSCWTIFVLPGCSPSLRGIQKFGNGVNKVVLTSGVSSYYLTDKSGFPTLLTTALTTLSITYYTTFLRLAQFYNWTTVMVVTESEGVNGGFFTQASGVCDVLSSATPRIVAYFVPASLTGPVTEDVLNGILDRFAASARIMIFIADSLPVNKLLIQAGVRGMNDGSYVYVLQTPLSVPYDGSRLRNISNEYHFEEARKIYPSCILVGLGSDREFIEGLSMARSHPFVKHWKAMSKKKYNYTYPQNKQPPLHAASSYASLMVVSQVADELRRQQPPFNFNDGALLASKFFLRTFETKVGNISLDHLGQRIPEILIGYFDSDDDRFVPFMSYKPNQNNQNFETLLPIKWSSGTWPVPSELRCGFQGMRCVTGPTHEAIGYSVAGTLVFLITCGAIFFRWFRNNLFESNQYWVLQRQYLLLPGCPRTSRLSFFSCLKLQAA
ncbi:hypothetical protein BV898_06016 [Hypsibius exemplaris]|uniref:Receptor ligand binding region domain-containing protein n=1 Tax=Hypsibius exemplaris TaxID=2072580 RepID=A0A1W0WY13_HYPEX|nr:hypothetical protein BV898_06016 [Hypsibius exemplaris]